VVGAYAVQQLGRYRIVSKLADGTELQSNQASYLKLEDESIVNLGARRRASTISPASASSPPAGSRRRGRRREIPGRRACAQADAARDHAGRASPVAQADAAQRTRSC
jgi:hypothetical protein